MDYENVVRLLEQSPQIRSLELLPRIPNHVVKRLKAPGRNIPRVLLHDEATPGRTQAGTLTWIGEQPCDCRGEPCGVVGYEDVLAMGNVDALAAERGGDHRLAHREGFQDLEPSPPADAHRRRGNGGPLEIGPDIGNAAGHQDAGPAEPVQIVLLAVPDDGHRGTGVQQQEFRQDLVEEPLDGIDVGAVAERAEEQDRSRVRVTAMGLELVGIDGVGNHDNLCSGGVALDRRQFAFGGHRYPVRPPPPLLLDPAELPVFDRAERSAKGGALTLGHAVQHFVFHVVLVEDDSRAARYFKAAELAALDLNDVEAAVAHLRVDGLLHVPGVQFPYVEWCRGEKRGELIETSG